MSKNQQSLVRVVPRIQQMEQFIDTVKAHPTSNIEKLFTELFNLTNNELNSMLFFGMVNINSNVKHLEKQLHKIKQLNFETYIESELVRLQRKYPSGRSVKYGLFLLDENDDFVRDRLGGVSAFTDYNGNLCFIVYPDEKVRSILKSIIAHEYHHHWRIKKLGTTEKNETLLDRLVLEGLAEHFVRIELGEACLGPMMRALSEEEARTLWNTKYLEHLSDHGDKTDPFMFGDKDQGIPLWAGYSIGYYIVKWFIEKHNFKSIEELTELPSNNFIVK
ncbi:DUF2268 domain-containing protein [Virgibacillus flavescens]|uniref:DUF2268 domain-containing protein n=1 Tax=Virgibacillus flavescens TaxID=1611422 RepID=UPI003D324FE6